MKIKTIIPARGGSKGIPKKNIVDVNGKPLIWYVINASLSSNVDETWVSTDCENIRMISENIGAKVLVRPSQFATDQSKSEDTLLHFLKNVDTDIVVFLQATSPLTEFYDINAAIDMMDKFDSVISVCNDHGGWLCGGFKWKEYNGAAHAEYDINNRPMRQNKAKLYRENGAIYISSREMIIKSMNRISGNIGLYEMPRQRSFEVDNMEDLDEIRKYIGNVK